MCTSDAFLYSRSTRQSLRQRKSSEKESSEGDTSKENIEHSPGQEVRKTGEEDPDRTQSDEEISRISAEAELEVRLEKNPVKYWVMAFGSFSNICYLL